MKFKALTVLLLAWITGSTAAAACTQTFNLGVLGPPALRIFGNDFASTTHFEDCYSFTLSAPADAYGAAFEFDVSSLRNIDITSLSLSGGSLGSMRVDTTPSTFSFSNLASGVYQFVVTGDVTGRNGFDWFGQVGYIGTVVTASAVAVPVPEPQTYALLAAGLLAVGLTMRRRHLS